MDVWAVIAVTALLGGAVWYWLRRNFRDSYDTSEPYPYDEPARHRYADHSDGDPPSDSN